MKRIFERYPLKTKRALEILIPTSTWLLITLPLWLSIWHPAVTAYFIIIFDIYWFYKSALLGINAVKSYIILSAHTQIDWLKIAKKLKNFNRVYHVVIIPEFKEPLGVLRETFSYLSKQDFPTKKILIVLATESWDKTAKETFLTLKREFGNFFGNFIMTIHPEISGEVKGKSSNMAWAAKEIVAILEKKAMGLKFVTITSCDADSLLHPKYFSYLTHLFLTDKDRDFHFYQAVIMFYSNIYRVPLFSRVLNTIGSIFSLSKITQPGRYINFSTYSLSIQTVKNVGFWGTDIIPEDYHLFFKVYFKFGDKVKMLPIALPVLSRIPESTSYFKSLRAQYHQFQRWAWGVSDDPWVIRNYFLDQKIPFWDKTIRLIFLLEEHILWPVNWFIITIGSSIPPLINPVFERTVLGHNLPRISSFILTVCLIFLFIIILIDLKVKPKKPKDFPFYKTPILFLQWLSLPVASFFLSALPGLDAHTRLLLGKRLEYKLTEKI